MVGSARKREHENKTEKKNRFPIMLSYFAYLSLMRHPYYLRAWDRLDSE